MKKRFYETPEAEVTEVVMEGHFLLSVCTGSRSSYGPANEGVSETDSDGNWIWD